MRKQLQCHRLEEVMRKTAPSSGQEAWCLHQFSQSCWSRRGRPLPQLCWEERQGRETQPPRCLSLALVYQAISKGTKHVQCCFFAVMQLRVYSTLRTKALRWKLLNHAIGCVRVCGCRPFPRGRKCCSPPSLFLFRDTVKCAQHNLKTCPHET